MKIYRYKKNGLLYILYRVTPQRWMGRWYEAHPFNHNVKIGNQRPGFQLPKGVIFKADMKLTDFEPVYER